MLILLFLSILNLKYHLVTSLNTLLIILLIKKKSMKLKILFAAFFLLYFYPVILAQQKQIKYKVPKSIPLNVEDFIMDKFNESPKDDIYRIREINSSLFEIVDSETKTIYLYDNIEKKLIDDNEFRLLFPEFESPFDQKTFKSGETVRFDDIFFLCSGTNFTGAKAFDIEVDVPAYYFQEISNSPTEFGAKSHFARNGLQLVGNTYYECTVQADIIVPGLTRLHRTLASYPNICIEYSGWACVKYLSGNLRKVAIRCCVDVVDPNPQFTIPNKQEVLWSPSSEDGYFRQVFIDPGETCNLYAPNLNPNVRCYLTIEKCSSWQRVQIYVRDSILTSNEINSMIMGTFNLTSWCNNSKRNINISEYGQYIIRLGINYDYSSYLPRYWLVEHVKCLQVTTCHPSRVRTESITVNTTISATTTIEASNQIIQPASVIYQAGQKITLKEGFKVNMGATFKTIIADCTF